jgi:hypothetical protein
MALKVFVCRGKSCRKLKKKNKVLIKSLSDVATVEEVECQDICSGPVVVLPIKGRLVWFERVDSKKSGNALAELAAGGKMAKTLKKRLVKRGKKSVR